MSTATVAEVQTSGVRLHVPGPIVSPDWVAHHLNHPTLCLLDVRAQESYDEGHIPGAVWVDLAAFDEVQNGVPGMLVPPEPFAHAMGRLGVDQGQAVVIYDDNWGLPAARLLWALARYGHANAAVLTGGSDRWVEEGGPWTPDRFVASPADFVVQPEDGHLAERDWLRGWIGHPALVLLDTRAPGEYAQGHIPGAICWDWINGVPAGSWDTCRPAGELLAELTQLGVTADKEIVTYCRSGVRAAHTYLLLRSLGYPHVRLYDGSWLEWSRYQGGENGGGPVDDTY
ncbi:MAG: sulfurtransferase [Ardenticatenaceae bacterium]|nr:sulfurtransferase [Ardenticatenaceae bacterium]